VCNAYRRKALRHAGLGFEPGIGKHSTFRSTARSDERRPQLRARAPRHDSSGEERKRIWWGEATGRRARALKGESLQRRVTPSHPNHGLSNRSATSVLPVTLRGPKRRGLPRGNANGQCRKHGQRSEGLRGCAVDSRAREQFRLQRGEKEREPLLHWIKRSSLRRRLRARRVSGGEWHLKISSENRKRLIRYPFFVMRQPWQGVLIQLGVAQSIHQRKLMRR